MRPLTVVLTLVLSAIAAPALAAPPCAGATWGLIPDPSNSLHVSTTGDDEGEGTATDPFLTLGHAIHESRAAGVTKKIALHPGTFDGGVALLKNAPQSTTDNGLSIYGCSASEVTLVEPTGGSGNPIVEVAGAINVLVQGVTLDGGRRTLEVHSGADVILRDSTVTGGKRQTVFVDGSATELAMADVEVVDPLTESGAYGWGVAVQDGTLLMTRGGVSGATEVGIFADGAALVDLLDVDVSDTVANSAGTYGRGIQLQAVKDASVVGGLISGNVDAGLFVSESDSVVIDGIQVDIPTQGVIPGSSETTGDGVVVTRAGSTSAPSNFLADIDDVDVTDSDRAGIVLDGVTATLDGTTASGTGGPVPSGWSAPAVVYLQDSSTASGADLSERYHVADIASDDFDELGLNTAKLSADSL